jgi:hypothetical protein
MAQATIPAPAVSQQLAREFGLGAEECAKVREITGHTPEPDPAQRVQHHVVGAF